MLVERPLLVRERTREDDFHFGWDVRGDVTLEAAENERGNLPAYFYKAGGGVAQHDTFKVCTLAEQARHEEPENRPEIGGAVL